MYELVMTGGVLDPHTGPCERRCSWPAQGPGQETWPLTLATASRGCWEEGGTISRSCVEPHIGLRGHVSPPSLQALHPPLTMMVLPGNVELTAGQG